jgi:hypothetical protein
MANVGDVNNDGYDDLLVGLAMSDLTYTWAGRLTSTGGPTADALPAPAGRGGSGDEYGEYVSPAAT